MKISELINSLQSIKDKQGDLEVCYRDSEQGHQLTVSTVNSEMSDSELGSIVVILD